MSNTITKFAKYVDMLDEVYKNASCSAILDGDSTLVKQGANANEIVIPKMSLDGLADYSRSGGYVGGDATLTNETVQFNFDRGRAFTIDAMDNEETAGVAFGKLSAEFMRTKVVPEVDAFTFAKIAGTTGIGKVDSGATLSTGADVVSAIRVGLNAMDEAEVPMESRVLFITPTLYNLVADLDTTKSKAILDGLTVVKVPQTRFYTAITQYDGVTDTSASDGGVNQKVGGYVKGSGAKDINFLLVEKSAIIKFPKHKLDKAISPEENQSADAWKFCTREYGIVDVYENKVAGVYLHHKA